MYGDEYYGDSYFKYEDRNGYDNGYGYNNGYLEKDKKQEKFPTKSIRTWRQMVAMVIWNRYNRCN